MKRYRHRRSANPANAFPSLLEPGELAVNTANRQLAVGDSNATTVGVPIALLAIRYFDVRASYASGDIVVQAGNIYKANAAIQPGAFNASNWTQLGAAGGGSAATVTFAPAGNIAATNVQAAIVELDTEKVAKAGDVMSGHLSLPTGPAAANAVRKDYVDTADAALTTAINNKSSLTVSDTPPSSPVDGALWWESDTGMLYVRYNDGVGPAQWVQAAAVPSLDPTAFVAKTGDIMTGHLSLPVTPAAANAVRKDYVDAAITAYAAPLDALAYSGMQINGGMEVNQPGVPLTNATGYICDGWRIGFAGGMGFTGTVDNGGGTVFYTPYRLIVTITPAQVSLGAGDYLQVIHRIEGFRTLRMRWGTANAQPLTIGFWTAHARPGLYSVGVQNSGATRSYVTTYTQNAAATAQYNVVTIPGDTAGAWAIDNTLGIQLMFSMGCGTTFTAPAANAWQAGNYIAAPGQVNAVAATTDAFRLTGVVVLPGSQAPTAAQSPMIMRPYDQELVTCQRYWQPSWLIWNGYANPGSNFYGTSSLLTPMRAAPTLTGVNQNVNGFPASVGSLSLQGNVVIDEIRTANATAQCWFFTSITADARL